LKLDAFRNRTPRAPSKPVVGFYYRTAFHRPEAVFCLPFSCGSANEWTHDAIAPLYITPALVCPLSWSSCGTCAELRLWAHWNISFVIPTEVEGPHKCGTRHASRRGSSTALGMTTLRGLVAHVRRALQPRRSIKISH